VGRVGEEAQMVDLGHSADLHLAQQTDRLAPTEGLLDPLADALADRVPRVTGGAAINGRTAVHGVLGDVRRGIAAAQLVDEVGRVVAPIGTDRHAVAPGQADAHVHGGRALPGAAGWGQFVIHDQAVAVLHLNMALVAKLRALASALAVQPRLRIRLGGMGVVTALLSMEIPLAVAPGTRTGTTPVLGPKALHRRPGLDQGAVHAEVLVGQELRSTRLVHHLAEEGPSNIRFEQPVPVLGEGRVISDRIIHRQPDEPAKQQVVVDLLDQQAVGAEGARISDRPGGAFKAVLAAALLPGAEPRRACLECGQGLGVWTRCRGKQGNLALIIRGALMRSTDKLKRLFHEPHVAYFLKDASGDIVPAQYPLTLSDSPLARVHNQLSCKITHLVSWLVQTQTVVPKRHSRSAIITGVRLLEN